SRPFEVSEDLVVVLMGAAPLDGVPFPGDVRIVVPARIAPPPDLIALVVCPKDDVGVAVAVDVVNRSAGFDGEKFFLNDVAAPTAGIAPIPDQRWRPLPET